MLSEKPRAEFEWLIDLAAERLGGRALACSDEFFAPKENLLKPGRGIFIPDKYTENGKWMDGWESRRKRTPGHDWCVIQLGLPGVIRGIDVDTNHFLGNAPATVSMEGIRGDGFTSAETMIECGEWVEVLPRSPVQPGSQNLFAVTASQALTHVRLNIFPDGGVARFRVYGDVVPDWPRIQDEHRVIDLAAVEHGGLVVAASDSFFSDRRNLILPGDSTHMGDGWETKRRRGPGHDWAIVRLGRPGRIQRAVIDTTHYKGNYPDTCSLEGCRVASDGDLEKAEWAEILPRTKLQAHRKHVFEKLPGGPFSHVRLSIHPDGGIARLRLFGAIE
jgi:allantoicase